MFSKRAKRFYSEVDGMLFDQGALVASAFGRTWTGRGSAANTCKPLARNLRGICDGDSYDATISGTYQYEDGITVPVSGTATVMVTPHLFEGRTVLAMSSLVRLTIDGIPQNSTTVRYYSHDHATGDLLFLANLDSTGAVQAIKTPCVDTPGVFSEGSGFTQMRVFVDEHSEDTTFTVVGSETMKIPLGNFAVWKCRETTDSSLNQVTATSWYAPQIGPMPLKEHNVIVFRDSGDTMTVETVIHATSVTV